MLPGTQVLFNRGEAVWGPAPIGVRVEGVEFDEVVLHESDLNAFISHLKAKQERNAPS